MRVVSLVPSVTETLIGGASSPPRHPLLRSAELPSVGGTKDPDVAAIVALAPDLVW